MSQVEKKSGLLRRTSSSKKPLKEKVVLMYDDIFSVSIKGADVLIGRNSNLQGVYVCLALEGRPS